MTYLVASLPYYFSRGEFGSRVWLEVATLAEAAPESRVVKARAHSVKEVKDLGRGRTTLGLEL